MMSVLRNLAIFLVLVYSCKPSESNVNYRLSDEQLARLMFDIQLSEVALSEVSGERQDSLKNLFWLRFADVYKLSTAEMTEEIRNLENDPEKLKVVLDRVQALSDEIK
jgi:hypothetical protein